MCVTYRRSVAVKTEGYDWCHHHWDWDHVSWSFHRCGSLSAPFSFALSCSVLFSLSHGHSLSSFFSLSSFVSLSLPPSFSLSLDHSRTLYASLPLCLSVSLFFTVFVLSHPLMLRFSLPFPSLSHFLSPFSLFHTLFPLPFLPLVSLPFLSLHYLSPVFLSFFFPSHAHILLSLSHTHTYTPDAVYTGHTRTKFTRDTLYT